jgi:hypothetical protein
MVITQTRWATSAGDFLPFTPLPQSYHGASVALVALSREQAAMAEDGGRIAVTVTPAETVDSADLFSIIDGETGSDT